MLLEHEAPFVPYPQHPDLLEISGTTMAIYIKGEDVLRYVDRLIERVPFEQFSAVMVNMKGGHWLFSRLRRLGVISHLPVYEIEYHRPEGGFSANITKPIPLSFRNKKILITEDVWDSGGVGTAIKNDAPEATILTVARKDVEGQLKVPGVYSAMVVEDRWLGGGGMEMVSGVPIGELIIRNLDAIVAKVDGDLKNLSRYQNPFVTKY